MEAILNTLILTLPNPIKSPGCLLNAQKTSESTLGKVDSCASKLTHLGLLKQHCHRRRKKSPLTPFNKQREAQLYKDPYRTPTTGLPFAQAATLSTTPHSLQAMISPSLSLLLFLQSSKPTSPVQLELLKSQLHTQVANEEAA